MMVPDSRSFSELMQGSSNDDRFALGRLKEKRGEFDEALQIYRKIPKSDAKHHEAQHRTAVVLMKMNKLAEAKTAFETAIAVEEPSGKLLNDFGYYHFLTGDDASAEKYYRKALEKDPDFTPAWTNLGLTFGAQERFEEARRAFQRTGKSAAEVHANMGYVLASRKMFEAAQTEFAQALKEQPDLEPAVEGLLQVSSKVPGREAVTVVKTIGTPHESKSADESSAEQDSDAGVPQSVPFVKSHRNGDHLQIRPLPPTDSPEEKP